MWTESVLYSFAGGADGETPIGGLVSMNGGLYGTTALEGTKGGGTIFMIAPGSNGGWTEYVLYEFQGGRDGAYSEGALVVAPNSVSKGRAVVYGTTRLGGDSGQGTVFEATVPLPFNFHPLFTAQCSIVCLENSSSSFLPLPFTILGPQNIGFDGIVQNVTDNGKTVQFLVRQALPPTRTPRGAESDRKLTVNFERPGTFTAGEHWMLVTKDPLVVLSPQITLLGFWRISPGPEETTK